MNKNYINIIRKSLNNEREEELKNNKKNIFSLCDTKLDSKIVVEGRRKIKKKVKPEYSQNNWAKKKKKSKKLTKMTISEDIQSFENSVSGSSTRFSLTPSKSEIHLLTQEMRTHSDSDESEFELDEFSNSRDHITNESLIESYSEIENEFNTMSIECVKISTNKLIENNEKKRDQEIHVRQSSVNNTNDSHPTNFKNRKTVNTSKDKNLNKISDSNQILSHTNNCEPDFQEVNNIIEANSIEEASSIKEDNNPDEIDNTDEVFEYLISDTDNSLTNNLDTNPSPLDDSAKYFEFDNVIVVILKEQRSISVYGNFMIQILRGQVQILGSTLNNLSGMTEIYSPRGYSLLTITNNTFDESEVLLKDLYQFPVYKDKILNSVVDRNSAVFLCFKIKNEQLKFIQKYISQQIFPKIQNENLPQVIFEPKDNMNFILENDEWESIGELVNSTTKMFIAGGKGVGKSTFLRYLINKLLNKFDKIRIIDLDPGQSEFFMPGCISVIDVSELCIGPNFTHLRQPERSYICDISVADPVAYIRNIKSLMDYVSNLDKIPTLINYMGYSKGLGIHIVSSVITIVKPTNIIQIESRFKNKNFICDLNLANVRKNCNYFGGVHAGLNYRVHKLFSFAEETTGWKLEPRQARELCILAYLGEGMTESIASLTDHNLPMYEIMLSSVTLRTFKNKEIPPAAINANLVALCKLDETYQTFICLGFGVVRGIDLENDYLVLVTQVDQELLNEVTCLVLSSISLPPSIYMTPQNIRGLMPYVLEGELTSLAQLTKRSYIPAGYMSTK